MISTPIEDEAYTLFEVLNDRSMALTNLDLLKNLFFKTYAQTSSDSDEVKSQNIKLLDDLWCGEIFKKNRSDSCHKLISLLAVAYISGKETLTNKRSDKDFREAIKSYLNQYISDEKKYYDFEKINRDFHIFLCCADILDGAGIKYSNEKSLAYESAYTNKSTVYKTLHFLKGNKQDTMMVGLVAVILNYIRHNTNNENFVKEKYKETIHSIMNNGIQEVSDEARSLWRMAMKNSDIRPALGFSNRMLGSNNLKSKIFKITSLTENELTNMTNSFNDWLDNWTYKKSSTFKIRMLFAKAFNLTFDGKKYVNKPFQLTLQQVTKTDDNGRLRKEFPSLDIDHMEPSKEEDFQLSSFFKHNNRTGIINQLGNMMILTSTANRSKSNSPMESVFWYLEEMNLQDHFLTKNIRDLLSEFHTKYGEIQIPTEKFFDERKKYLMEVFSQIVDQPF